MRSSDDARYKKGLKDGRRGGAIEKDAMDKPYLDGVIQSLSKRGLEDPIKLSNRAPLDDEKLIDRCVGLGKRLPDMDGIYDSYIPNLNLLIHKQLHH